MDKHTDILTDRQNQIQGLFKDFQELYGRYTKKDWIKSNWHF